MSENVVKSARKASMENFPAAEKARIVLEGLRQEQGISELCQREDIPEDIYHGWEKAFVEAGKQRLMADQATQNQSAAGAALLDTDLLRSITDNCPANLLMSRIKDGKVLYRSPSTEATFGAPEHTRDHWASQEARKQFLKRLKRDGQVDNMFFMGRRRDGTAFPAQLSSRLIRYEGEDVNVSTSTDLTQVYAMRDENDLANARLRDAIEALSEGFVLYDQDQRFVMANSQYRKTLAPYRHLMKPGAPMSKITGKAIADGYLKIITPHTGDYQDILKTVTVGKPNQVEIQLADGTQKITTLSRLGDGGLAVTLVDITDRRKVEVRAREMMNDIIQSLDEGLSLYDADLKFIMRNSRRYEMISDGIQQLQVGRHLSDVTLEIARSGNIVLEDDETPEEWSARIVELTRNCAQNIEIPGSDGRLYVLSVHKTELGGYLLIFKDITEQRRAEQAERESDMLLRVIVEACPTTFLVSRIDDGEIIYYPPASRDRFGDIESTLEFFLSPADRVAYLNTLLPTGTLDDYPVRFRRRDGSIMQGLTSARVTDYKGEDVIVSSTRDISDQLAMQAELEHQRNIAHQNEKLSALGELLAGVAHELNNPLSIVVGYAMMLQNKFDDPKLNQRVERIGQAAERCAKIVKMFLAMARQRPTRIENCSLNGILETALEVSGYRLKAAGVNIKLELDPELPCAAVDFDQITQVFSNLIFNAEHAVVGLGEKGRLKLISMHDKFTDEVVIKVRDNGAGVPKKIQPRIFEPFFTTKDVGTGTGVGLAFSHRIIDSHGGSLTLHSVPGEGATFIIRLPATEVSDDKDMDKTVDLDTSKFRRVLVVDDEVGVTDLIRDILQENHYDVWVENDPRSALELLKTQNFDAILSDMKMPGLDGEALLEIIKTDSPQHARRVAFITGDTMSSHVAEFFEASAVPYLEKPIAPADLTDLLRLLCAAA